MLCKFPTVFPNSYHGVPSPCGQCLPCLINRTRVWSNRMICEAAGHDDNSFLTCTYSDEFLPADYSLNFDHHKQFMYRFRDAFRRETGRKIRFYMAGEYGETTFRPHYHYALFGFPPCPYGGGRRVGSRYVPCQCSICSFVTRAWKMGQIHLGTLTPDSARYTAKYITSNSDRASADRILGRVPEDSRMSTKPGIGFNAVSEICRHLTTYGIQVDDFPAVLLHGGKPLPLGRYMSGKIYDQMGIEFEPGERALKYKQELSLMFSSPQLVETEAASWFRTIRSSGDPCIEKALQLLNSQRVLNVESKQRFFRKGAIL